MTMNPTYEQRDLDLIWHPCSQMKDYETLPPIVIDHGKGVWLYDMHGHKYLDIVSSWWANLLGHCNPDINAAIKEQLNQLEHVIFANFRHKPAIALAEQLNRSTPTKIRKFHFNDNGSASVECALKMCFQFYQQGGKPEKKRFMCLTGGYHGETIGALSVGSMDLYAKLYQPMMMDNIHIEAPDCYRCPYGKMRDHCQCECFEHAEQAFAAHGSETAAMIAEPLLQGSAGMRIYPPLYLRKLRQLCDCYDVKLILDEIATGFGRTGTMFACEQAGISPDIMCISKGLTGGYLPMSVTCVSQEIYDAFYADYGEGRAFLHSHTYAGNPLGCAAALAVQKALRAVNDRTDASGQVEVALRACAAGAVRECHSVVAAVVQRVRRRDNRTSGLRRDRLHAQPAGDHDDRLRPLRYGVRQSAFCLHAVAQKIQIHRAKHFFAQ